MGGRTNQAKNIKQGAGPDVPLVLVSFNIVHSSNEFHYSLLIHSCQLLFEKQDHLSLTRALRPKMSSARCLVERS